MSAANMEPVEQWLAVHKYLIAADRVPADEYTYLNLWLAVKNLYKLLEPPSVREARLKDG